MFYCLLIERTLSARFCIDPGFDGTWDNPKTKDIGVHTLLVSKEIAKHIANAGHVCYLTRVDMSGVGVRNRFQFGNYIGCDMFLTVKRNTNDEVETAIGIDALVPVNSFTHNDWILRNNTIQAALSVGQSVEREDMFYTDDSANVYSSSPTTVLFLLFYNERENSVFFEYYKEYAEAIATAMINSTNYFI